MNIIWLRRFVECTCITVVRLHSIELFITFFKGTTNKKNVLLRCHVLRFFAGRLSELLFRFLEAPLEEDLKTL